MLQILIKRENMHKCSRKILVLRNKAVLATTGNELIGTGRLTMGTRGSYYSGTDWPVAQESKRARELASTREREREAV